MFKENSSNFKYAVDIGSSRQVFIDGRYVEKAKDVEIKVHKPKKTKELNIYPQYPWEYRIMGYSTVLKIGDEYRMWYDAVGFNKISIDNIDKVWKPEKEENNTEPYIRSLCYATSKDGIHWEKPMLNLADELVFEENNIIMGHGAGGQKGNFSGCVVIMHPNTSEGESFKMIATYGDEFSHGIGLFSSSDGIHWRSVKEHILKNSTRKHLDSQNIIFWDDRIKKYVAYVRRNTNPLGYGQFRTIARSESEVLDNFTDADEIPVVFQSDCFDISNFQPKLGYEVPIVDYYTSGAIKYPWAQDAYFMFPTAYLKYDNFDGRYFSEFKEERPVNSGPVDIRFAASRDGISWLRYDRKVLVPLGMRGEFDSKQAYMICGLVSGVDEKEMYMYYCGTDELHGWNRNKENNRILGNAGLTPTKGISAISRLVFRCDGFTSVRSSYTGGDFVTCLLRFKGNRLELNIDTSALGELRVEIQDETGQPIKGYNLNECDRIHTTNEIHRIVTWKANSDVSSLEGKPIRIRFSSHDSDLYAFQFIDKRV